MLIDIEKRTHSWMQYRCSTRSACDTRRASVGIYARVSGITFTHRFPPI